MPHRSAGALALLLCGCIAEVGPGDDLLREAQQSQDRVLPVPFLTQKPNEKACTAASLAMSLKYYGVTRLDDGRQSWTTSQAVYDWFSSQGYLDPASGYVTTEKVPEAAGALSGGSVAATVEWWPDDSPDPIRAAIDDGSPVMLFAYHDKLPGSGITKRYGHNILAYGYSGDTFYYYNPYKWTASAGAFSISSSALADALMAKVQIRFDGPAPGAEGAPAQITVGGFARVTAYGLNFRRPVNGLPSIKGQLIAYLRPPAVLAVIGGPVQADYYTWWNLRRLDDGQVGWGAEGIYGKKFIEPVAAP